MRNKFITLGEACKRITQDEDFIDMLSERLALDEILCGECNPSEFLRETIKDVLNDRLVTYHKNRIATLKEGTTL
jgi:hypothetical protein